MAQLQVNKEARNEVIILPVHYGEDETETEARKRNGADHRSDISDSEEDEEDETV